MPIHSLARPCLVCLSALVVAAPAYAAPVVIRGDQSVGRPRRDAQGGICATAVHLRDSGMAAFNSIEQAVAALSQPKGAGAVDDKVTRAFKLINFRNADVGAQGDFTGPGSEEAYFPFSDDALASPRGDNRNFALRLRGYLSVPRAGLFTVGVNADDAHRLSIAGTALTESEERISARVTRQVRFEAPGLYPIELIYYQNGSTAVLEVSQAEGEFAEGFTNFIDTQDFQLVPTGRLFTARTGQGPCVECGGGAMCPGDSFCADGLCQPCITSQHCGAGCNACPDRTPVCKAGACVECAGDYHCPPGRVCDVARGTCSAGTPCRSNADCPTGRVCDPESGVCAAPADPCASDIDCAADLLCDTRRGRCVPPPAPCRMDSDCPGAQVCDPEQGLCRWPPRGRYVGGSGCSAAGGAPGAPAALFGLLLLAGLLRRRRLIAVAALVFFCMTPGRAAAQISANAQTFRPAIGPRNVVTIEGTNTQRRLRPAVAGVLEFAYRPLRLVDPDTGETLADTVRTMTSLHLLAGLGLTDWLSMSAALPIVLYQQFDPRTPPSDVPQGPSPFGVGDLRLVGKLRILDNTDRGFGLAFVPQFSFPIAKGEDLRGEDAFGIEPRGAVDYRFPGGAFIAANVGFLLRTSEQVVRDMLVTHQIRYGVGGYVPVLKGFGAGAELVGGTSLGRRGSGPVYSPLEAYLVARWQHPSGLQADLGGGWGFTGAVGSPQFRLFAAVAYVPLGGKRAPADPDPDGDGLVGDADKCPRQAGPVENQGCPDKDTDSDGVIDRLDACPTQPGPAANQGCPDKDTDRDGIPDRLDACPTQPGPAETQGCPESDTDKDGIVDRLDKCPYDPGPQPDGCPRRKYITVHEDKIELRQKVYFATNKSAVSRQSFPLLDEIADVLRRRPTMELLIEGHTDSRGSMAWNMKLSEARALSVRDYLVKAGVDPGRLTAKGYGPTRPVADNKTAAGREKNRRTEFLILQQ